jgi:hypothetical protein
MNPNVKNTMPSDVSAASAKVPGGPRWNAVKHGLRSAAILLPGDDVAEFQALRCDLFHTYQPCTRDEADCVEGMAGYKWRIARCQRRQAGYEVALDAVIAGSPTGHICEPDPHRWQHRSMDCLLEEQRLHKLMTKDRATLFELQRMRRNRLIDGAITMMASYREFMGEANAAEARTGQAGAEVPATASADGENRENFKRHPAPGPARMRGGREEAMPWMRKREMDATQTAPPLAGRATQIGPRP